jgi:HlyD family secretion protein
MTADIETDTKTGVLAVPIQSVTVRGKKIEEPSEKEEVAEGEAQFAGSTASKRDDEIEEVIFIVVDGKVKTVNVKRGISDDEYVQVSGEELENGEVVSGPFRAINRELENGTKVRVENKRTRITGSSVAS